MTKTDIIKFWLNGADDAISTAAELIKVKKYHFALFFCHLTLEKALKAKIAQTNQTILPIHDLVRLTKTANLKLSLSQEKELNEINAFNVRARYDDYKLKFYKKATQPYATKWFNRTKEYLKWLTKI